MKAIICTGYGGPDVLQLVEVDTPEPADNEVLVRIHTASATAADTMMRRGKPFYGRLFIGLTKPKQPIPGTGFSGTVEAVGEDVTEFGVGDEVFGETAVKFSTNAEYVAVPWDGLVLRKPTVFSHDEAATLCDGPLTSLNFLKNIAGVHAGQRVLVNGASGSLGTAAVQLARHMGAHVTGVCSAANVHLVESLGAVRVIDYRKEDFTQERGAYDVIFDTVGKSSFSSCKDALTSGGQYVSPVLGFPLLLQMLWTSRIGDRRAKFSATGLLPIPELRVLLKEILDVIEAGNLRVIIDRRYPLEETADAHRYIETGRKKGNVVVHPGS